MRTLGWLLVAYAGIGAIFLAVALVAGGPLMARADRLATSASGSLDSAAGAAEAAAGSLGGFDDSLGRARSSTEQAAGLTADAAHTMDSLAEAMSVNVLGAQPLLPLAGDFRTNAEQLRNLGDSLGGIGQALSTNQSDLALVGVQLHRLAQDLGALRGGIRQEQSGTGLPLSWLFYGFLAWQLLPIAGAAVGGRWLLARTRAGSE
ncbi:MAG TPA: hypothetical protein VF153_09200 [Candidatus Limnocylindria bacterium]